MSESRLVYSTDTGGTRSRSMSSRRAAPSTKKRSKAENRDADDGIIRIKREVKGRKGKMVTTISGFQKNDAKLKKIASELQNRCGTGGSVKDNVIMFYNP